MRETKEITQDMNQVAVILLWNVLKFVFMVSTCCLAREAGTSMGVYLSDHLGGPLKENNNTAGVSFSWW